MIALLFYLLVLVAIFLVCIFVGLFFISQLLAAFTLNAPFIPIPKKIVKDVVTHLHLQNDSILYDLGCGDGRILLETSTHCPGIKCVGIERAFFPYLLAKFKTRHIPTIEIRRENIFNTTISDATHVFMYLWPGMPDKILPLLEKKCKPGTRVISCDFECMYRPATETITLHENTVRGKKLFVYTL